MLNKTQIDPTLISGNDFATLDEELRDFRERTGHLAGQVATRTGLNLKIYNANEQVFIIDEGKYVKYVDGVWQDVSASDPTLAGRVDTLETDVAAIQSGGGGGGVNLAALSTMVQSFTEDFNTQNKIDASKTTAAVSNVLRGSKIASFKDFFNDTTNFDSENSTNVKVENGYATMVDSAYQGIFVGKAIPVNAAQRVKVDAAINHKSQMAFSQSSPIRNDLTTKVYNATTVVDRSGRTWYLTMTTGPAIAWEVVDANGVQVGTGSLALANPAVAPAYVSAVVDYNNNIWFSYKANAAGYHNITIGAIKQDGTALFTPKSPIASVNSGSITLSHRCSMVVDVNNRVWIVYSSSSSANTFFAAYNADGSAYIAQTIAYAAYSPFPCITYDSTRNRIIISPFNTSTSSGTVRFVAVDVVGGAISLTYAGELSILTTRQGSDIYYDATRDELITVYVARPSGATDSTKTTDGLLKMERRNPSTLALIATYTISGTYVAGNDVNSNVSVIKDGGVYRIAYTSFKETGTYTNVRYATVDASTFVVIEADVPVAVAASVNYTLGNIGKTATGKTEIIAGTTRYIHLLTSTIVSPKVSHDNGVTWYDAPLGTLVTFPQATNSIKVRFDMTSPYSGVYVAPEILDYQISDFNGSTGALQSLFVSSKLPAVSPVAFATLDAEQNVNDGAIAWELSNDGGLTWHAATLGQKLNFPNPMYTDLRVRATLSSPDGAAVDPVVATYTIVTTNTISATEMQERESLIQSQLAETNFKLASFMNATRYGMKNMFVDAFNDNSGIDAAYVSAYDSVNKQIAGGGAGATVITTAETVVSAPNYAMVTATQTGTVSYHVSRDDGVTWTEVAPGVETSIASQPSGTQLRIKAVMEANATVKYIALSWR